MTRYQGIWDKYLKPLNAVNCEIGGDCVENILWRAKDNVFTKFT